MTVTAMTIKIQDADGRTFIHSDADVDTPNAFAAMLDVCDAWVDIYPSPFKREPANSSFEHVSWLRDDVITTRRANVRTSNNPTWAPTDRENAATALAIVLSDYTR